MRRSATAGLTVLRFLSGDVQEYAGFGELPEKIKELTYQQVVLNTSASVTADSIVGGNMTEAALNKYLADYRMERTPERVRFAPFNSASKYSWAQVKSGDASYCLVKGAPEKLLLPRLRVVARALPMDKSRLVRLSQELNLVVGMTGDGVNDSPALKKADVGFAMGSGTEVAKEAGDIVILNDNFLSIKKAILYGRTIYNSICKFIVFQLTINLSAVAISFIAPFIGIDKPLTITQILWINLVMDTLAALAFGGEPALAEYLQERPKRRSAPLVSREMLASIAMGGAYMTLVAIAFFKSAWVDHLFRDAADHIYTYTGFFCTYIFMAVANGFNVRTPDLQLLKNLELNKGFLRVMALIVAIQVLLTYAGGSILRTAPLNAHEWLVVIFFGASIIAADLLRKLLVKYYAAAGVPGNP